MKPNYTDITFILDSSASMNAIADAAIAGFNGFVRDQQGVPGAATVTLVQFNQNRHATFEAAPIHDVPDLDRESYRPDGGTALLDAVGLSIEETGRRLAALAERDRPAKVIVVIITDGHENASRHYSQRQVADMISHQRQKYGWRFVFLGANQDVILEAEKLGIEANLAENFQATGQGTRSAFNSISGTISKLRIDTVDSSDP
jgi:Mg-chelatase subunit ChlD